jgi:hypothetical protein
MNGHETSPMKSLGKHAVGRLSQIVMEQSVLAE